MSIPCGHGMFNGYRSSKPLPKRTQSLLERLILPPLMIGFVIVMSVMTAFIPKNGERE